MDALSVVWHGNYVKYMERGRESFGQKFGLEYMRIYDNGFVVPVVDMHIRYLVSAHAGDRLRLETSLKIHSSAKLHFFYSLYKESDNQLIMHPTFFSEWKKKIMKKYFFFESEPEKTEDNYKIDVILNDECSVYKGHFPGNPISPGVCNMNMIRECAEKITGSRLRIKEIAHCRFLALITPQNTPKLTVSLNMAEEDDLSYNVTANISDKSGKIFVDFKGKMTKI